MSVTEVKRPNFYEPPPKDTDLEVTDVTLTEIVTVSGVNCKIMVRNNGPNAAEKVVVEATVSSGVAQTNSFSPPNVWNRTGDLTYLANVGNLAVGASSAPLTFHIIPAGFPFKLTAHVSSDITGETKESNNTKEATILF